MATARARNDTLAMTALAEVAWGHRHEPGGHWITVLNEFGDVDAENDHHITNLLIFSEPDRQQKFSDKLYTNITQPADLPGNLEAMVAAGADQDAPAPAPIGSAGRWV